MIQNDFVYCTIAFDDLTLTEMQSVMDFAPPPPAIVGFLYRRVYMFLSKSPTGYSVTLPPHRDQGSGPLVYGMGTSGSYTHVACMQPTNSRSPPDQLNDAFTEYSTPSHVHYVRLTQRGDFVCIPSLYWHTVESSGMRVCVSYFDHTMDST